MEPDRSYEIFRKELDNTTVVVESVKGIDQAQRRVEELNRTEPGEHFIFDPVHVSIVEPDRRRNTAFPIVLLRADARTRQRAGGFKTSRRTSSRRVTPRLPQTTGYTFSS